MAKPRDVRAAASGIAKRFRLGDAIVADPVRHSIIRDGRTIAVEPRVMQLLTYLAGRPGHIISKEELREQVWGTHVVDEAVHRAISLLRSALGDSAREPLVIETLPRHGYRLLVPPAAVGESGVRPLKKRALGWAGAAAGVAALALLVSPGWKSGPALAPTLPRVASQQPASASIAELDVARVDQQPTRHAIAAVPKPPVGRSGDESRAPAADPEPAGIGLPTSDPPAQAPAAPTAAAPQPGEAPAPQARETPAPRAEPPVARQPAPLAQAS